MIILKVLGLDISSATIGWALLETKHKKPKLISYGHLRPPSKKQSKDNFSLRLDFGFNEITNLIKNLKPDIVVIEDYAKGFSKGLSSANTIIVLASFNEVCGLASYRVLGVKPTRMPVTTLRKLVNTEYSESIKDKEDVMKFCKKQFNNFVTVNNRVGNIKIQCYDEADAIIVALGYHIDNK